MKKVLGVFLQDLKSISKSKAAILIVIGLCILPSLYAWINIKASWNPYANTGNLPIAVANNDEGVAYNGQEINVGNQIVEELKKNRDIAWIFTDSWQGNYGLNEGKYYALIEIPNDFSRKIVTLTTENPIKPDIVYRVNEKLNAIASKITNAATLELADKVKRNFVAAVTKEVLKTLNPVGGTLQTDKAKILQLRDTVTQASNNIEDIKGFIAKANSNAESLQSYLNSVKNTLPKLNEQINSLQNVAEANKSLILATKQSINTIESNINNDLIQLQTINQQSQTLLSTLKSMSAASSTSDLVSIINQISAPLSSAANLIDADIKSLELLNQSYPNKAFTQLISLLDDLKRLITAEETKVNGLKTLLDNGASRESIASAIDQISALNNQVSDNLSRIFNNFYSVSTNVLNNLANNLTGSMDNSDAILEATRIIIPQLNALANYGIASSELSVKEANDLSNKLSALQNELNDLSVKMQNLNQENLDQIIDLMKMNPGMVSDFLSSPINVKEIDIYNMGIFGVGLTPFYTVLAIWVGGLLLSSLLSVEHTALEDAGNQKLTIMQAHYGKMLLFLAISIIQALIVTLGDKYILGVNPANMPLMMGFAILSAICFTTIIFTLVSIFGNVGKAMVVVIMVFQIAGSGGIYPIQTNPRIFGILQPLWPFTYAIGGFREAIAGPIWSSVIRYSIALLLFICVFLFLAILKKPFHKVTAYMEHKFRESGL
ncbi:YhgE/Pip-like protein [Desulfosporosinus orientis DSM 765]|uniref:YhgE/Pip-like protein n=1 Tax=Desulfosporosinus orientis (strain ATCC 19365 / DSM 765 / NCIMB 8382 / VKM B-1628 / Singapore I) TaxID=768706 RepID=G7W904_DESOD|nr:YhgE/Pip domain-containing protein [Desulfosporosinus orientis]AET68213.1 YhgE/Pip-like protein [Desulfosporosinus orientis DSM 765]